MTERLDYLPCDHCGDTAVQGKPGRNGLVLFCEGDADRCESCGIPGNISVDEWDEESDGVGTAYFSVDEAGHCTDPNCTECAELRLEQLSHLCEHGNRPSDCDQCTSGTKP